MCAWRICIWFGGILEKYISISICSFVAGWCGLWYKDIRVRAARARFDVAAPTQIEFLMYSLGSPLKRNPPSKRAGLYNIPSLSYDSLNRRHKQDEANNMPLCGDSRLSFEYSIETGRLFFLNPPLRKGLSSSGVAYHFQITDTTLPGYWTVGTSVRCRMFLYVSAGWSRPLLLLHFPFHSSFCAIIWYFCRR